MLVSRLIRSRTFSTGTPRSAKKKHKKQLWPDDVQTHTSINRALEHYDDLYASVYTSRWPSMRLGLLSSQKFIAVPNNYTANVESISRELEAEGAYDLQTLWATGQERLKTEREEINLKQERARLQELEKTLESIAETKVAEELDTLYQNAPERKLVVRASEGIYDDRRVLKDIRDASAEFVTATKLKGVEDFQFESEYYSYYSDKPSSRSDLSSYCTFTDSSNFSQLGFPFLKAFTFEPGNISLFPSPGKDRHTGLRKYICVNGASLAPIIALDLKPDVKVLDLCSGPGTKSLLTLMTMCPESLTCNDLQSNRLSRVYRIFEEFIGNSHPPNVNYTKYSAARYPTSPDFHRVLADVPCSSDRISLTVADNSIFKATRTKERLGLVTLQKDILLSAFKCLTKDDGSACVYSTCTLSPIENDGTVAAALKETAVESLSVDLMGLWEALLPFKILNLFNLTRTRFGVVIEPNVCSNFGPMYVSRIVVKKPVLEIY